MILLSTFLLATFVTMVLIPPLMRAAVPLRFIDVPDERKQHAAPVPRIGGIAMVAGTLLPVLLWLPFERGTVALVLGSLIILAFGVWDDRRNLDYRVKFLGQLIAIALVVGYGGVLIQALPFMGDQPLPLYVAIPLTVFALLGITNAINLADGLDGLAGGTTLLSVGAIGLLAFSADNAVVTLVSVAVIGSILGFLRFNTHPARIFMGDGGSQFLGFAAGVLAIQLTQGEGAIISPALPLLLLGLPILDTLLVMVQRIYEGRSPFSPDRNHVHHKLLSIGFDHYEAVSLIYMVQAGLVAGACLLRYQSDVLIVALYTLFCVAVTASLVSATAFNWRVHRALAYGSETAFTQRVRLLHRSGRAQDMAVRAVVWSLPVYYAVSIMAAPAVSVDIAVLAGVLMVLLLAVRAKDPDRPFTWIERVVAYALGAVMVYLSAQGAETSPMLAVLSGIYFVLLAIVVAAFAFFGGRRRFRLTPLDILVVFLAFVAPYLAGNVFSGMNYGILVAKAVVVFYALELVLANERRQWRSMRVVQLMALAALVAAALT